MVVVVVVVVVEEIAVMKIDERKTSCKSTVLHSSVTVLKLSGSVAVFFFT